MAFMNSTVTTVMLAVASTLTK